MGTASSVGAFGKQFWYQGTSSFNADAIVLSKEPKVVAYIVH